MIIEPSNLYFTLEMSHFEWNPKVCIGDGGGGLWSALHTCFNSSVVEGLCQVHCLNDFKRAGKNHIAILSHYC